MALSHYGRACACCGSKDNLCIDHVNGGGEKHRQELGLVGGGPRFWSWLIEQDFPPGYQVLCKSCNSSKSNRAACSHARK